MSYPSPLDHFVAFALAFVCGVLVAVSHCKYVSRIHKELSVHA